MIKLTKDQKELKKKFRGKTLLVMSEYGVIDFSPDISDIVGGQNLSYDDYLNIVIGSKEPVRSSFQEAFYMGIATIFYGKISVIRGKQICFKELAVETVANNGEVYFGKEDHVWMPKKEFEGYQVGDSLSFNAEIYRYYKKKTQSINYALRNPANIEVSRYRQPTERELLFQEIDKIVCETCLYADHCYFGNCLNTKMRIDRFFDILASILPIEEIDFIYGYSDRWIDEFLEWQKR